VVGGIKLKALEVEGFRGVNQRIRLEFGPNATVISARNGKGKSTLLGAIEWALFGELRFQPTENRTRDELVSLFHPGGRATVDLTLTSNGHDVRVNRTRMIGKMASDLRVVSDDGATLENDEASNYLFRLLGLSFDDFYRAAFLHQDSIRGLLTEEQKDRDEALDRLLGVDEIRNILTSIPMRPVTTALEEIEDTERTLMQHLSGAGTVADDARKNALQEATDSGYEESQLTLEFGRKQGSSLLSYLAEASSKYAGESFEVFPVESLEDIEKVAQRVKRTNRDIRVSVGRESPLDAAVDHLADLKKWAVEIEGARAEFAKAKAELQGHEKEYGKPDDWSKERSTLEAAIKENDSALHVLDVHGRVVADAIAYLEAVPTSRECPVCGDPKEAAKLALLLRTKVKKDQASTIARLNKENEVAKERLRVLTDVAKDRESLETEAQESEAELCQTSETTWKALGKKGPVGDVLKTIKEEREATEGKLSQLRNANQAREGELQKLDDEADKIRLLVRFLKADSDLKRVREKAITGEGGGSRALEDDKKRLQDLRLQLEAIAKVLNGLATGRAEDALARCGEDISRTYGRLCQHPYFDGLKIEVGQKTVQGVDRNTYKIIAYSSRDGQRTSASSRLSTAQMNCVALSAYLSLAQVLSHNLGFVMMDDPSQNLDSTHKKALASVIKDLLPSEQLVIGTHDSEFDGLLRSELGAKGVMWFDLEWTPKEGTTLKPYGSVAA
jgi:DNA repair exonuclease SbcCD ATPase subunit